MEIDISVTVPRICSVAIVSVIDTTLVIQEACNYSGYTIVVESGSEVIRLVRNDLALNKQLTVELKEKPEEVRIYIQ